MPAAIPEVYLQESGREGGEVLLCPVSTRATSTKQPANRAAQSVPEKAALCVTAPGI